MKISKKLKASAAVAAFGLVAGIFFAPAANAAEGDVDPNAAVSVEAPAPAADPNAAASEPAPSTDAAPVAPEVAAANEEADVSTGSAATDATASADVAVDVSVDAPSVDTAVASAVAPAAAIAPEAPVQAAAVEAPVTAAVIVEGESYMQLTSPVSLVANDSGLVAASFSYDLKPEATSALLEVYALDANGQEAWYYTPQYTSVTGPGTFSTSFTLAPGTYYFYPTGSGPCGDCQSQVLLTADKQPIQFIVPEKPTYTTGAQFGDVKCVEGAASVDVSLVTTEPNGRDASIVYGIDGSGDYETVLGTTSNGIFTVTVPIATTGTTAVSVSYDAGFKNPDGSIQWVYAGDRDYTFPSDCVVTPPDVTVEAEEVVRKSYTTDSEIVYNTAVIPSQEFVEFFDVATGEVVSGEVIIPAEGIDFDSRSTDENVTVIGEPQPFDFVPFTKIVQGDPTSKLYCDAKIVVTTYEETQWVREVVKGELTEWRAGTTKIISDERPATDKELAAGCAVTPPVHPEEPKPPVVTPETPILPGTPAAPAAPVAVVQAGTLPATGIDGGQLGMLIIGAIVLIGVGVATRGTAIWRRIADKQS